jgi:hypothetical protein
MTSITLSGTQLRDLQATGRCEVSRKMRPQPERFHCGTVITPHLLGDPNEFLVEYWQRQKRSFANFGRCEILRAPFAAGQRLKVREAWATGSDLDKYSPSVIAFKCEDAGFHGPSWGCPACPLYYKVDGTHVAWSDNDLENFGEIGRWRSAATMPLWASRYEVTVDAVRAEHCDGVWRWFAGVVR